MWQSQANAWYLNDSLFTCLTIQLICKHILQMAYTIHYTYFVRQTKEAHEGICLLFLYNDVRQDTRLPVIQTR